MDKRRLGRTDYEITPIGLGCMQFSGSGVGEGFFPPIEARTAAEVVGTALKGGVNWFDTAEMYGRGQSERALTTALKEHGVAPGEVVIATKWTPILRTAASVEKTIGDRVDALQGYPIDLHQIHTAQGNLSPHTAQLAAMARLRSAGKIASVGVSSFSAAQMERAAAFLEARGTVLASNQVQINLLNRAIERNGVLASARRLGITLIAFSPLRLGILTGKFHQEPERIKSLGRMRRMLVSEYRPSGLRRTAPLIDELRAIGAAYGVSAAQVALNWLITYYGDTVVAIPGASKPHHAAESTAAMDFRLTEKETDRLDRLSRQCGAR
ncbi:aldo/keto reductase [Allonocardiopsis opalescens]|uniref:Aryl-alcohol dehydrogenase-like predicted oxidoreductase n=1 Tax=Allonocardiopsis opalescens TaxID=1144618 RepID=A0A2T0Q5H2_9ACTN|nr:aldo/keto reductase [Allonocardiopsis opalescens]PRX99023.1 aryl-alcohol dehydrogenase-like predicted oxidoreductase [Allonocardiopsis opalescens]